MELKDMNHVISRLTVEQIQNRVLSFENKYIDDWNRWLRVRRNYPQEQSAPEFGRILRKWQACRPNKMRRCRDYANHGAPYLEDLFQIGIGALNALTEFDFRKAISVNQEGENELLKLWDIFTELSYEGKCRNGRTGVVGISKAVLLLTEGRVGPAFDSNVTNQLGIGEILTAARWIECLKDVAKDIKQFERLNKCKLGEAVPRKFSNLHYGRLYDMILGPGTNNTSKASKAQKKPTHSPSSTEPALKKLRIIGKLNTHGGGNAKEFKWIYQDDYVRITNEDKREHKFSLTEIQNILTWLVSRFGRDWFPLGNNVANIGQNIEKDGLGVAILQQRPGDISHAQGSSYLGVVLEDVGILEWNNKQKGIEWRIIGLPESLTDLRSIFSARTD